MDQPNVLRTTKIGGGFVKEDVLAYVDELNSQIYQLQEERDELKRNAQSGGGIDQAKVDEYESELTRLRGELGTTKNQLRACREELQNRPVIEGGGGESAEALAAAKQEAVDAKADLAAAQAELELAQAETAELNEKLAALQNQVDTLGADNDALRQDLAEAAAQAIMGGGNSEESAKQIAELQARLAAAEGNAQQFSAKADASAQEIETLRAELEAKNAMIEEQAGLSNEADLQKLAEYEALLSEQTSSIAAKNREIESLQQQIADLKENSADSSFDMSALFMEAQMTAKKVASEARKEADKRIADAKAQAESIVKEATDKAEQTISDANAQAEKTVSDANALAQKTIADANAEAEQKINDADAKAIKTVADAEESVRSSVEEAERRNKTTTETARTVRALLRSEIDGVSKKFNEIAMVLENLSTQANSRLGEAKNVINEARSTVNDDDDLPSFESFDEVASKTFSDVDKSDKSEFNFDDLAQSAGDSDSSWS